MVWGRRLVRTRSRLPVKLDGLHTDVGEVQERSAGRLQEASTTWRYLLTW